MYVILCTPNKWQKYNKVFVPYFFHKWYIRYLTTISLILHNLLLISNDSTKKSQTTDQSCQNLISMNWTKLDKNRNYQTIFFGQRKLSNNYCYISKRQKCLSYIIQVLSCTQNFKIWLKYTYLIVPLFLKKIVKKIISQNQWMTEAAFSHWAKGEGWRQKNIRHLAKYQSRSRMLKFS